MTNRKIIHVDMDCFYAAVEVKHNPTLSGKPLGIGGPPNTRSVLCTANYEARKFNVKAAMPSSQAVRLCPQLILIPPHFDLYKKESQKVREIFYRFTNKVEPLSLDEAYLDVTESTLFGGSATLIAQEIRRLIQTELQLTASAGIASNKFLAKIASDWKKPNGQFVIRPAEVEKFMKTLQVEKIYGVGKVTAQKMHDLGIRTCGDLQKYSVFNLARAFGSRASELKELAQGIDHRPVEANNERKSLTVEETFNQDLSTLDQCLKQVPRLYEDWQHRMLKYKEQDRIRGFVVKVKFSDFKSTTHEVSAKYWPQIQDFTKLLSEVWERRSDPVRLMGLGVRLASESVERNSGQMKFAL